MTACSKQSTHLSHAVAYSDGSEAVKPEQLKGKFDQVYLFIISNINFITCLTLYTEKFIFCAIEVRH